MAEEQESTLLLPPSTAPEAEVPAEVSPETATPEPPSSAAVSPGTEEPVGDTKKKIYLRESVLCPLPRPGSWDPL
uniref:Autophagy related 12 n=1 Tax=Ovis aries TaxID=9940 RepID=A0AC11ESG9_SHEEP